MTNPPPLDAVRRILVLQFRPFGDVILSTAGMELLQKRFPNAVIHYATSSPFHTVIEEHPYIKEVIKLKPAKGFKRYTQFANWMKVRKGKYDLVIDYQSGTESALYLLFSGAKFRLGWDKFKWPSLLEIKAEKPSEKYSAIRNLAMLKPLGVEADTCHLFVTPSQKGLADVQQFYASHQLNDNRVVVGVAVGSKDPRKQWYLEGFVGLIEKTTALSPKIHIVLLYAPNEKEDALKVYEQTKNLAVSMYVPTPSMRDVAALLKKLDLLICNEGALNHLSCATNTQTICLIGPTNAKLWSPQGYFPQHYHLQNEAKKTDKDFGYQADEVLDKVKECLEGEL